MNIAIIYISKYGTTKKISEKIAEKFNNHTVQMINLEENKQLNLQKYDMIILGAGVYAGKISKKMYDFAEKNKEILTSIILGLFICGMELDQSKVNEELKNAYPEVISEHAKVKSLLGGEFLFEEMGFFEKMIIKKIAKTDKSISRINEKAINDFVKELIG